MNSNTFCITDYSPEQLSVANTYTVFGNVVNYSLNESGLYLVDYLTFNEGSLKTIGVDKYGKGDGYESLVLQKDFFCKDFKLRTHVVSYSSDRSVCINKYVVTSYKLEEKEFNLLELDLLKPFFRALTAGRKLENYMSNPDIYEGYIPVQHKNVRETYNNLLTNWSLIEEHLNSMLSNVTPAL